MVGNYTAVRQDPGALAAGDGQETVPAGDLEPGDRVIVTAIQRMRPGAPVEVEGDGR